jgi:molybdenum cofactor biosynthesis enzyme
VIGIARIAAIQGAKRTADLVPLCHPLAHHARGGRLRTRHRAQRGALHAQVETWAAPAWRWKR